MASYTLDVGPYWPAGTTLNAYTTASFGLPGGQSPNGTPPVGSPVDTAVVSSAGTVTFSALAVNVGYRIGPGTNPYFYLHFKEGAPTTSAGSGGGAGVANLTPTAVKTGAYTLANGDLARADTSSGVVPFTLPAATAGAITAARLVAGTNNLTVTTAGSDVFNVAGGPTSITLNPSKPGGVFIATAGVWVFAYADLSLTQLDARYRIGNQTIAYAATVTANADLGEIVNVAALTGNVTLANPTGTPLDGQRLRYRLAQDATGNRVVSFGTQFAFGTDVIQAMLPTAASASYELMFAWHVGSSKWRCLSIARGF